ncbi:MAG: hypothetical protein MSC30_06945 [Gaiellaceae bacterium MAG52_C11]|nr:hypothetical protein [Candidatus Gaiellasilicea maunaloa]
MSKTRAAAIVASLTVSVAGVVAPVAGAATSPPRDERCKVPPLLFQVAAVVDPDSLEGCGFFEDPNYFENRKEQGTYTDQGVFSRLFG